MGFEEGREGNNRKCRVADLTSGVLSALGFRNGRGEGTEGGSGQMLASSSNLGACRTGGGLNGIRD